MIIAGQQAVSLTNYYQTDHISSVVQTHYLDFVNGITINFSQKSNQIDQFRHIKIQPKTIDQRHQALGNNYRVCGVSTQEPRVEVYRVYRLNSNISKSVYWLTEEA